MQKTKRKPMPKNGDTPKPKSTMVAGGKSLINMKGMM